MAETTRTHLQNSEASDVIGAQFPSLTSGSKVQSFEWVSRNGSRTLKILATIGWLRYEDQDGSENGAKLSVAGRVVPEF